MRIPSCQGLTGFNGFAVLYQQDCTVSCTIGFGFHLTGSSRTRCCTTDVERTHGQLSTWLTNGLSCNHTNCLTGVNQFTACQVATITVRTQTMTGFTSNRCTDFDFIDAGLVDHIYQFLGQQRTGFNQSFASRRIDNIRSCNTTQNTLTQSFNYVTALYHCLHHKAV